LLVPGAAQAVLVFSFVGYVTEEWPVGKAHTLNVKLRAAVSSLQEVVVTGQGMKITGR
jgi:hypothetical protein